MLLQSCTKYGRTSSVAAGGLSIFFFPFRPFPMTSAEARVSLCIGKAVTAAVAFWVRPGILIASAIKKPPSERRLLG